mmetsp:Transcript_14687/g.42085  ORF Transcript_14687/g.42085 Transcript_14687/m.42085 type:complete len:456 (+) Transcript_14687:56-1423(+)
MAQLLDTEVPDALLPYKSKLSPRYFEVRSNVIKFIKEACIPATGTWQQQRAELMKTVSDPLECPMPPILNDLRREAKARGLLNLFLPEVCKMSVLEYSPIAEILGAYGIANLAMNCSAPDTGNMEVIEKFGSPEQKEQWLKPLLEGEIRSAFCMTEPGVASSDATNISCRMERDGDEYIVNGHKWWASGAIRPECKLLVVLGKTSFTGPIHKQQTMMLIPKDTPGVKVLRGLKVFGHTGDHAEIIFDDVRVPASAVVLGEGRGFEIAQGRLGPGRIHHCMRSLGVAEQALAAMVDRAHRRKAFGQLLAEKDGVRQMIAEARMEITMCQQLCYLAACVADEKGFKAAKSHIAMIKVAGIRAVIKIIDDAIQLHGAHGVSQDSKLEEMYRSYRYLRVGDGPDIVHLMTIAKDELARGGGKVGRRVSGINPNVAKYGKFSHVEHGALYVEGSARASKL